MHSLTRFESVEIPASTIEKITVLYDRGLYVQAYQAAGEFGDFRGWKGTAARLIGGRLAGNLGSRQLANWLHLRAWRAEKSHTEAAYFCGLTVMERRGPLAAWKFAGRLRKPAPDDPIRGDLCTFRARVLATFRDFERAEAELAEAEACGANLPWLWCERATIYEMEDRYSEALEAANESLRLRPWFRPAVQQAAHLLQLIGKDEEAVTLLTESLQQIESGACAGQLAAILEELGRYDEAIPAWEKMRTLHLLADADATRAWHARMADLLYLAKSRDEAAKHARLAENAGFYDKFAERLKSPDSKDQKRVHLPVGFVRQHHVTCAPATLTAVAGFLGESIDHLTLAREITYDGTPDHVERAWAERNGFFVREFRVTWEVAVALIDRGIPFTLTTTEITSGHLQAVIGYDALRQTLIIRDPYQRHHSEFNIEPLLKRYAAFGPRGMVLLPKREAHRVDGVILPDAAFFDSYYRLRRGLHGHDRAATDAAAAELEAADPNHRLTLFAKRDLAYYDGNLARQLAATNDLLQLYPNEGSFLFGKSRALGELADPREYEAFLQDLAGKDVDPLFWREWANRMAADARSRTQALRLLRRVLRVRPVDSENLATFANVLWDEREFSQATELYRFAACLRDTIDGFSRSYFLAARHLRATDDALRWLRERHARHGNRSSQPARVLFWALQTLDRSNEAFVVLEEALAARPDDADLLLHAADAFGRQGRADRAEALLTAAESRCARSAWLRTAAMIADYQGALSRALALWRELLAMEPLIADAQRSTMRLVAEVEGRAAALAQIEDLAQRFPHHVPTHRLWVEFARFEGSEAWERVVRRALALDPDDAWLRRELALVLTQERRFDEAMVEADAAVQIEPQNAVSHGIRGNILLSAQRLPDARAALHDALRLSIDSPGIIHDLIAASPTLAEKRAAADFIRAELIRQVVFGDGLLGFRESFYSVLEPQEMLAAVQEAHTARPDLWHAWSALIRQLVDMRRLDEALERATDCAGRFPSVPGAWSDLALVHRLKGDREGEIRALRRALILNPSWGSASRELAAAHESRAEFDDARRVLESAVAAAPLDAANHGALADLLWRRGDRATAIERIIAAVQRDPGYGTGWDLLRHWTSEIHEPERAISVAQELTTSRPGEARSWYFLAQILPAERSAEAINAIDRAIELSPRMVDGHDLRAFLLARDGRFDQAIAACSPEVFGEAIPPTLLIRAAWIEARRGHRPLAIEKARTALEAHPHFYWGWSEVAEWTFQLGRHKESLAASERLVRLSPRAAVPLGYMARAQHALGQTREAFATLERAFDLDPTYEFAGFTLLNHQLEARDLHHAAETLARLETHLPGPRTQAARVSLLAKRKDRVPALEALRSLLFCVECPAGVLSEAVEACIHAGWTASVERLLSELLDQVGVNPEVGPLWVLRFTSTGQWRKRKRIYELNPRTEIGRRTRFAFVAAIGERRQIRYLQKLIARERDALRENTSIWGQVGYAYAANGRWRDAISWMDDWHERKDLEPWMLSNLALALRHQSRNVDAATVNEHALTLRGDHTTSDHHTWLALDSAVTGKLDEAQQHVARAADRKGYAVRDAAHAVASAILAVHAASPDRRKAEFEAQRRVLQDSRFRNSFRSPIVSDLSRRGVEQMARAAGQRPFRLTRFLDRFSTPASSPRQDQASYKWVVWVVAMVTLNIVRLATPSVGRNDSGSSRPMAWASTPKRFATPDFLNLATPVLRPSKRPSATPKPEITLELPARPRVAPFSLEPTSTPNPTR